MRLAANLAIDRQAINQAETLGFSKITGSMIPHTFEFFWPPPAAVVRSRRRPSSSSPRPGTRTGFDAGDYYCDASYANLAEAVVNYLKAAGIRAQLRPLERAAFIAQNQPEEAEEHHPDGERRVRERRHAARRLRGRRAAPSRYGSYPDIEGLLSEQAGERDAKKRRSDPAPDPADDPRQGDGRADLGAGVPERARAARGGVGLTLITSHPYSSPYEDLKLKGKCLRERP